MGKLLKKQSNCVGSSEPDCDSKVYLLSLFTVLRQLLTSKTQNKLSGIIQISQFFPWPGMMIFKNNKTVQSREASLH